MDKEDWVKCVEVAESYGVILAITDYGFPVFTVALTSELPTDCVYCKESISVGCVGEFSVHSKSLEVESACCRDCFSVLHRDIYSEKINKLKEVLKDNPCDEGSVCTIKHLLHEIKRRISEKDY